MTNQLAIIEQQTMDLLNKEWNILKKYSKTGDEQAKDIMRTAALAIMDSADLQKALQTPQGQVALIHAMKYALRTGLSLNPQEGKSALIAYGGKVQYQIMKNGYVEKAMSSPNVKLLNSKVIKENDTFELSEDETGCHYTFKPALTNRGKVLGYAAVLVFHTGEVYAEYMTREEVEAHQNVYVKYKSAAWRDSFDGMALKTVIKKLLRNVSVSPELKEAVGIDDNQEAIVNDIEIADAEEIQDINAKLAKAKEEKEAQEPKVLTPEEQAEIAKQEAQG